MLCISISVTTCLLASSLFLEINSCISKMSFYTIFASKEASTQTCTSSKNLLTGYIFQFFWRATYILTWKEIVFHELLFASSCFFLYLHKAGLKMVAVLCTLCHSFLITIAVLKFFPRTAGPWSESTLCNALLSSMFASGVISSWSGLWQGALFNH